MVRDRSELESQEHFSYGKVFLERGEPDRALDEFKAAYELDPNNSHILIGLGECYLLLSKPTEAIAELEKAVNVATDFADAHYHLGRAYMEIDLREKAINEFKEALNINPKYGAAKQLMNGLLKSRETRKQKKDEKNGMDPAEEQISRQANIHFHLGNALFQKNLFQEALAEYKEAIRLRPNYPDIRNRVGELYMKRGQFNLAEEEFMVALKINPRYVAAILNLAESYRNHSETLLVKAEESYQKVIDLDTENNKARRGLEIIRSIRNIDFV